MLYVSFIEFDSDRSSSGFFLHAPGCIFSCSDPSKAVENAASAIDAHFELLASKGMQIPTPPENWCLCKASKQELEQGVENGAWFNFEIDIEKYTLKS
ncbi:type II toxin-antitoxin system HicB family antitoxin [Pantoea sp. SIMBA_133]